MLDELMPNRLTDYLYGVSEAFNAFYTECKVRGLTPLCVAGGG
jgi:arginyl-tRNA synthetase